MRIAFSAALCASFGILSVALPGSAEAGGFAIREQSVSSQGASFAGSAAGGDLSSMFWNPAAVTVKDGVNTESHASLILPESELTATGGTLFGGGSNTSGEIGNDALVGASYANMQLSNFDKNLYVGFSMTAPFGLVTEPEDKTWAGSPIGKTSKIFNVNINPVIGYKIAPGISVAAGAQFNYMEATLKFGQVGQPNIFYKGDDISWGWNIGILVEPLKGTTIGAGYKSKIENKLEGIIGDGFQPIRAPFNVDLNTPETFTVSLRQNVTDKLRLLATYEWTGWSSFDQLDLIPQNAIPTFLNLALGGGQVVVPSTPGQALVTLPANWEDSWFVSGGAEYDYSDKLTVRAGIGYEESPIQTPQQRLTVVPDNIRVWLSGGATYKWSESMTFDAAYTHIFVEDGEFDRSSLISSTLNLQGTVDSSVDIISVSMKMKLGEVYPK